MTKRVSPRLKAISRKGHMLLCVCGCVFSVYNGLLVMIKGRFGSPQFNIWYFQYKGTRSLAAGVKRGACFIRSTHFLDQYNQYNLFLCVRVCARLCCVYNLCECVRLQGG